MPPATEPSWRERLDLAALDHRPMGGPVARVLRAAGLEPESLTETERETLPRLVLDAELARYAGVGLTPEAWRKLPRLEQLAHAIAGLRAKW